MKTNQLMTVAFNFGDVEIFHKTSMGNLTQLWSVGNCMRIGDGKAIANLTTFVNSAKTKEFISELERMDICAIQVNGAGNKRKTWACLELMIYAAEYLSVSFHVEVIQSFIKGRLLEFRDESGDRYKSMNKAIDHYLPGREGKSNKGVMIQVARAIKSKVSSELVSWNFASAEELMFRSEIEGKVESFLHAGLVRDYDHLKELIKNM